ncbi:MAG TPA: hypothetical protein VM222_00815 [Planctomycetota bacterium]|nr:hypothetical protein [Planctomycetota bacterium]
MNDSAIKALVSVALLLQAAAVALGFTSVGWRWPVAAATAAVGLGILAVRVIDSPTVDGLGLAVIAFSVAALGAAAWHAASPSPVAAGMARILFGLEALGLLAILLFLLLFRMNRLW